MLPDASAWGIFEIDWIGLGWFEHEKVAVGVSGSLHFFISQNTCLHGRDTAVVGFGWQNPKQYIALCPLLSKFCANDGPTTVHAEQ